MSKYLEFEVSLEEISPRIWRRFLLRKNSTFHELHDTIQKACGWQDCHLYHFLEINSRRRIAESLYCEAYDDDSCPDTNEVKIDSFFKRVGDSCIYEYDFGDCWRHLVELKAITTISGQFRRKLIGGDRAFPPEDCGGTTGYELCVDSFFTSEAELEKREEYEKEEILSWREWMGDWDPRRFEFDATAKQLRRPVRWA